MSHAQEKKESREKEKLLIWNYIKAHLGGGTGQILDSCGA